MHVTASWFNTRLLKWFKVNGRHDLPWKAPGNAYWVWLSEIMLQQTQVTTVIPYFKQFIATFPNIEDLAHAPTSQVLSLWAGLGYYARARNLHKTAQIIAKEYQGQFPRTLAELSALPGIGPSTAGAILAQTFNLWAPILDGNVKRVLCRFHAIEGWPGTKSVEAQLWELAHYYTPQNKAADYTQAIMDLGATCCTRALPSCETCPLKKACIAYARHEQLSFPHKKPTKKLPTKITIMLLIKNTAGAILLEERPAKGIWGGLWSLPEFADENTLHHFLHHTLKLKDVKIEALSPLKHTFSHFHLKIYTKQLIIDTPLNISAKNRWVLVPPNKLKHHGLPAPIKKLLMR